MLNIALTKYENDLLAYSMVPLRASNSSSAEDKWPTSLEP